MRCFRLSRWSGSSGRQSLLAVLCLVNGLTLRAGTPDFEGARQFGYELQQDYLQRGAPALLERLDGEGMRRRTFASFGHAALQSEGVKSEWTATLFPTITRDLDTLAKFPTLTLDRVQLIDSSRALECSLVNQSGQFQIMTLVLDQNAAGRVGIVDYRLLGMETPMTRRLRHLYILLGAPFHPAMDEEEKDLVLHSDASHLTASLALSALGRGEAAEAFHHWGNLPVKLRGFPIWRDFRDRMAAEGSEKALAQQMEEYRAGRPLNPLVRLNQAHAQQDLDSALKALEGMLLEHPQSPFLRTVKAETLLRTGRAPRALALAEEVYRLYPFNVSAHLVAMQAAMAMGRMPAALAALNECHRVLPADAIEGMLAALEPLAGFRRSPEYLEWRQRAATTIVTAPAAPAPAH